MKSGRGEPQVLLLAMPWNRWDYPSIQVGLLKAYLRAHGVAAQARYPYLDLARRLGAETYNRLADKLPPLLAESFFTVGIHGGDSLPEAWVAELVATGELDEPQVRSITCAVRAFLDALYDAIAWREWDVVGLTCTFNQVFASLALAERIKRNHPGVRIVFGGSNLHGKLGQSFLEHFPCIDCVVSGPGEEALLRYVRRKRRRNGYSSMARATRRQHPLYRIMQSTSPACPRRGGPRPAWSRSRRGAVTTGAACFARRTWNPAAKCIQPTGSGLVSANC